MSKQLGFLRKRRLRSAIIAGVIISVLAHLLVFVLFQLSLAPQPEETRAPLEVELVDIPEFEWSKPPEFNVNIKDRIYNINREQYTAYLPNLELNYPMPRSPF